MTNTYRRNRKNKMPMIEAKSEAQKLAFAPLSFQATIAMRDLKILKTLEDNKEGLTVEEIKNKLNLTEYAISTLLEVALSLNIVSKNENEKFKLTKLGLVIQNDPMTIANMDFVNDVCYQGAFYTKESILNKKPEGLKTFGNWPTIYEGLSELPEKVKESWFKFDHYYSDISFDECLPIIFEENPLTIFDIGGNTGKFTIKCLNYNENVKVKMLDLEKQINLAKPNIEKNADITRASFHPVNMLETNIDIPDGAEAVWMSQFLDCFSKPEIENILRNIAKSLKDSAFVYILEPFWDKQNFKAATLSLNHTSLYFMTMANGNSKMYSSKEMEKMLKNTGFKIEKMYNNLGDNDYTLLKCKKI